MKLQELKEYLDNYAKFDISIKCREEVYIKMRCHFVGCSKYCSGIQSNKLIGSFIEMDHAGVIHSRKTLESLLFTDKQFKTEHFKILNHVKDNSDKVFTDLVDKIETYNEKKLKKRVIKLTRRNQSMNTLVGYYKRENKKLKKKLQNI